jgi:hypothetical protein
MADLPSHAEHLRFLAGSVSEIIVIDSHSRDGTADYLRKSLAGHNALFLDHPPGLYQSWNHAISSATQEYLTVATVGDVLPVESLERIHRTISKFDADVVITPPSFLDGDSSKGTNPWPIHDFIEAAGISDATEITGLVWMIYSIFYMPASLLSSSAGNLYRTRFLQENPYPHEYGHPGDSVWALQMSLKARWVIDPKATSYYKIHEKASHNTSTSQEAFEKLRMKSRLILEHSRDDLLGLGLTQSLLDDALECILSYGRAALVRQQYKEQRARLIPLFLNREARRLKILRRNLDTERRMRKKRLNDFVRQVNVSCLSRPSTAIGSQPIVL